MAEGHERQPGILRAAGRTALALLRQTQQRAKHGTLHLPLALHPLRQQSILLPPPPAEAGLDEPDTVHSPAEGAPARRAALAESRAVRSRLAGAERRVARLRHALERERQARAQATMAIQQPQPLIDHLVADLQGIDPQDSALLRQTVTAVLSAYGFHTAPIEERPAADKQERGHKGREAGQLPSIPGWNRQRLQGLAARLLAAQPEIGSPRYVYLGLEAISRQRSATVVSVATEAGLTSALARHRLRLALEALCVAGLARHEGSHYALATNTSSNRSQL